MRNVLLMMIAFVFSTYIQAQSINKIENLIAAERYDDAMDSLQYLKKTDPNNPYVYFSLGETELKSYINNPFSDTKSNVIKKALGYFNEGVQKDGNNPLNYVGLGIIELYQSGDTTKADVYFNKALGLLPTKKRKIMDLHIRTYVKLATAELYAEKPRFNKSINLLTKLQELAPNNPDIYIAYGDISMAQGNASNAIMNYKKALYIKNEPLTNVLIAKIYSLAKNLQESKQYYDAALKLDSLFAPAYKGLGDLYYLAGQNKVANNYYAKFLRLTGNNIPAKVDYAKALFKARDFDEALKTTEEVLRVDSSKLYLYRIAAYSAFDKKPRDLNSAYVNITKLFDKVKKDELITRDYLYYGNILLDLRRDSNDMKNGIQMLEAAYKADSSDVRILDEIVNSASYIKDYNTAIKYLTLQISKQKENVPPATYMRLGSMYYQSKKFPQADSVFNLVTTKDPNNIQAYLWKGYTESAMDPDLKQGLAKPSFEKLIDLASNNREANAKELTEAYSYLGSYYLFSPQPDLNKAITYDNELIALNPHDNATLLKAYNALAIVYLKRKEYEKAKEYYQKILSIDPTDQNAKSGLKSVNKYLNAMKNR